MTHSTHNGRDTIPNKQDARIISITARDETPSAEAAEATERRLALFEKGYEPIPTCGKYPTTGWNAPDWVAKEIQRKGGIDDWPIRFRWEMSTAVRIINRLGAVDLDINDKAMIDKVLEAIKRIAPEVWQRAPVRGGSGTNKLALFPRIEGEKFNRIGSHKYHRPDDPPEIYHHIEIFGSKLTKLGNCSRQFVLFGPRKFNRDEEGMSRRALVESGVKSTYQWDESRPALDAIALDDLPVLTKQQARAICDAFEYAVTAAGWIRVEDSNEGNEEEEDIFDIDRETTLFDVWQGDKTVSYDMLEDLYYYHTHLGRDLRVSPEFMDGVTTERPDRCTVYWSRRYDCAVIKDWKTFARHYPKEFAQVDDVAFGSRFKQWWDNYGDGIPIPDGWEFHDDPPLIVVDSGNDDEDDAPAPAKLADIPLPAGVDWMQPDGVLGEITDFTLRVSRWPNRPMAVGSAIATLSVMCGRWLYSPTGATLGVYIVCLAETGVGKDTPLSIPERVLRAAGLARLHTTGKAFSISALEQMMIKRPCCLATVDEIGASLFGRMSHRSANANEKEMLEFLLEMWSRYQHKGPYGLHKRAKELEKLKHLIPDEIVRPSLTLFGASGPKRFWESIPPGSIQDGFLNRFLLIYAAPRGDWQDVSEETNEVPQAIADKLQRLAPPVAGPLAGVFSVYDIATSPEALDAAVVRLSWNDDAVRARSDAFQNQIINIIDHNPTEKDLVRRVFEYAIRLASLHAVSRAGRDARVTMRDLDWGIALSLHAGHNLITKAARYMAENEVETKLNQVRNVIMDAGQITRSDLLRQIRSLNARDIKDAIDHLIGAGWVQKVKISTKGRPADGWKWL
jgi:hypothetical protein